jgi:ornithine decarboxylase
MRGAARVPVEMPRMLNNKKMQSLAKKHGTPLCVIDLDNLRRNYRLFRRHLPRAQAYYAVKANPAQCIISALYKMGASFDVASMPELDFVLDNIRGLTKPARQRFIWDKIIYANPIKADDTLRRLDPYKPLVTYDNFCEIEKIRRWAPRAGLALRLKVPNTGSVVELSSKFGAAPAEAVDLIKAAHKAGLIVEGLSFHVGSQCTNEANYVKALEISSAVFREAQERGFALKLLDIGGGFPAPYDDTVPQFETLARKISGELDRLFPPSVEILAEPGRFLVATTATLIAEVIGKAVRDGRPCYYIDDGVYSSYSGIVFDHCHYHVKAFKKGPKQLSAVFGPTCDALDTISLSEELPELELGDLVYSENIGAYSTASATHFNGMPPAKIVCVP